MDSSSVHSATRADDSYKSHAPEEHGCEISGITLQEEERERSESESESERGAGRRKGLWRERCAGTARTIFHHVKTHTGVGLVCAVAYFDPGNWGVDLQAGSEYGYRLLFVVLLAGLIAVFFQVLASRLGCVTGLDLASHCRLLLHDRPKHTFLYRWLGLYPLYILSETAIIATDLAELLGSAIALCLLFPKLELWHGVLITAFDVVLILALGDPLGGRPVKSFELVIAGLVLAVLVCMCIIIARVDVHWGDAFEGYLPSKYIFPNGALYTSVGILGATVMPHSLFLGSALATQDRITPPSEYATNAKSHSERNNNSLAFVKGHLYHGIVDVALSLLGFAVVINSAILILSSAVFFYGDDPRTMGSDKQAGLFDAYDLIKETVGQGAATLFAIALLAAGQSSSIIATVAGQAVSEGFLQWRTSAVVRRLLTRLLAIIPSMAVAIAVGRKGIDILLVTSQVVLCVVLPFISFPLIYLTSKKEVMAVKVPSSRPSLVPSATSSASSSSSTTLHPKETDDVEAEAVELAASGDVATDNAQEEEKMIYFNNGIVTKCIGGAIWILVMTANVYLLATLAMGKGNG
ncbi:transporter protein smf2 [Moniliophthora roreri MCA 2997]|uniref:Transporter protein smf2 n=1 Tax=Moniliophthora roreri (strain MCA 2997) TaxID=1381753 RepID=V2X0X1_MONRO|nr:transporter protein smf2 [Moniliophthora roreri MCA 2997]